MDFFIARRNLHMLGLGMQFVVVRFGGLVL